MGFISKSLLVTLIALWCLTASAFTEELNHVTQTPSSAPAPSPYHHGGHHHPHPPHGHHPHPHPHPHPPAKAPVYPPTKAPVKPPVKPPVKTPVSPPAKPPVKPPVYPPTKAPVKPPVKPPVSPAQPPVKPPVYPPTKAPTKAPVKPRVKPPVKPPVYPPTKAPVKPPTKAPVKPPVSPPTKPPVSPPTKPPVSPPVYPPKFNRSLLAVRGTVYCKSCKYASYNTLLGATPVEGAVVRLSCKGKKTIVAETTTDKNGYFLLLGPKTVTNYGFRGCRVYLVKSKDAKCSKVSKLFGGDVGAILKPVKIPGKSALVINKLPYGLFNVGPFAFDPTCTK